MGQIVKSKKKGRPSKADLAAEKKASASEKELRRSGRRRNVRCTFDFDDYLFDDEDEDEIGREKKLKLLLKLHSADDYPPSPPPPIHNSTAYSSHSSSDDEDNSNKRKYDVDYENDEFDDADNDDYNNVEVKRRKSEEARNDVDSAPGTPMEHSSRFPLPDKKELELILDKLQKKDRYHVYANPVDPEELPDYHDVITHPMDFSTIRRKLANGSYSTLEQFESDINLLCSNAMLYNAPDTVFHKQARSIQELAQKKLEQLKSENEPLEKEVVLEEKPKLTPIVKKQMRKPINRTPQEQPIVVPDFSSGPTLATVCDIPSFSNTVQENGIGNGKAISLDVIDEGNVSVIDTNLDKAEESLPGKGTLTRMGRKISIPDENRRGTYNEPLEPLPPTSDAIFSTFDEEIKQLIPVGLYAEYSYARSLARFAGTLGPAAWKIAAKKIEQVVPPGTKFGPGWVGEYEPLPTPIENYTITEPPFFRKPDISIPAPVPTSGGRSQTFNSTKLPITSPPTTSGVKQSFAGSASHNLNNQTRHIMNTEKRGLKQVEVNRGHVNNQTFTHLPLEGQFCNPTEALTPRSLEMVSMNTNLRPSGSFKQQSNNICNGKVGPTITGYPRVQEQALTDPVALMRMLSENNHNQQKFANQPLTNNDDSGNAAAAAARVWMSIGAGGFRPGNENMPGTNMQTQVSRFQPERNNNFPFHGFANQPQNRPVPVPGPGPGLGAGTYPQMLPTDLSRFQMPSPWRSFNNQTTQGPKQEILPPDLNVSFQSSGSPLVDSQQPDLALQL